MNAEGETITKLAEESNPSSELELNLFREGNHARIHEKLGAHRAQQNGLLGAHFAVWAPNANRVYVAGDFNGWNRAATPLSQCGESGVWAGFVPGVECGMAYNYHILSKHQNYRVDKADPLGFRQEGSPRYASLVTDLGYEWHDQTWMSSRHLRNRWDGPIAIYEVHLGSWRRVPEEGNRRLTFRELAARLPGYANQLGFTHVELMPVMEHPFYGPRDYEITGYFAPMSSFGGPQDLMFLIDELHQHSVGVILDWVPSHFPPEEHGLSYFDGTPLYEGGSSAFNVPFDGKALSFDYGHPEVRSFLLSNASFWLDKFHADGLRAEGVSSMLSLDYGRNPGEWAPNRYGGRENLEGIEFLRQLNTEVYRQFSDTQTFAEESTNWPSVSRPTYTGGLGFGFKWDTAFTDNTLQYFSHDPFFRKFHHQVFTARDSHAFAENFVLGFPHSAVQAGKSSLLARMPGDEWQRFANLRLMFGYQYLLPGKKLLFMGDELAQWRPWDREGSLDWHLSGFPPHAGMQLWVGDLNRVYRSEPALYQSDSVATGFEWIDCQDGEQSTLSWLRRDPRRREVLLAVCNFTPVVRRNFRVGVRRGGLWRELLNSDAKSYYGSGQGNLGGATTAPFSSQGFPHTLTITLPPLGVVLFKHEG